jgi:glutamate-1-semialdehyde 2,1-aminomutase
MKTMNQTKRPTRSALLFSRSQQYLVGGVSSMLRASVKPVPLFFRSACGSKVTDVDGNSYIDYTLGWGPLILGHSDPGVLEAVCGQMQRFQHLGAQHELEAKVAKKLCEMIPCAELVAFSNTGSEAVQVALRLARAFTQRQKFIKFEGHYHGWMDSVLVGNHSKGSSPSRNGHPGLTCEGQAQSVLNEVFVLPWNDPDALDALLQEHHDEIAAVITEPILCNCSCLMPQSGFLERVRELASSYGIVLIFDEVITGFRVAPGGAQSLFGVTPDLATFGKAVAAGFPLSVVAGKKDIMELIARGKVVHAGTFNGNPLALAAADTTLQILSADQGAALVKIRKRGERLIEGINALANEAGIRILINGVGSAFHLSFTSRKELRNYRDTLDCDLETRDQFLQAMLKSGIYLLPDGRWYLSAAHTEQDADITLEAVRRVFASLSKESTS